MTYVFFFLGAILLIPYLIGIAALFLILARYGQLPDKISINPIPIVLGILFWVIAYALR